MPSGTDPIPDAGGASLANAGGARPVPSGTAPFPRSGAPDPGAASASLHATTANAVAAAPAEALTIRVVVPRSVAGTVAALAEIEPRARARLAALAARLGVTRSFEIRLAPGDRPEDFAIDIGDARRGAAAASVLARAVLAAGADPLVDAPLTGDVARSLLDRLWQVGGGEPADTRRWCDAIGLVIHDVVAMHPRDLVSGEDLAAIVRSTEAWLRGRAAGTAGLRPTIAEVVDRVVDEMVSIGDHALIGEIAGAGITMGLAAVDIAERVIDRLRVRVLEIAVHPEYLEDLLGTDLAVHQRDDRSELDVAELSRDIASELARRTGLARPRVAFLEDWSLSPRRVVVLVNRTDRVEWLGPPVGARMVAASIGGEPARDPSAGQVVGSWRLPRAGRGGAGPPRVEAAGPDGTAFLVDAACDVVADRAALLVDRTSMMIRIAELERQSPYLASTVLADDPVDKLVRVTRVLARERVPLDLAALFSSWLGRSAVFADVMADDRPLDDRLVVGSGVDDVEVSVQIARLELVPRLLRQRADRIPARFLATSAGVRLTQMAPRELDAAAIELARRLPAPHATPLLLVVTPMAVRTRLARSMRAIRPDVTVISLEEADEVADLLRPGRAIELG
jgi:hypothetical protein